MDVKLSIGEEDVGMSNPIKEEGKKDEMDSLKEEDIWRSRQERMNNALAAARTTARQEPEDLYAAASRLGDVIKGADVEEFISVIERLADQTDPSATFNFQGLSRGSLLHIAAKTGKDDILRLLVDYVGDHLIAAQNDWGETPLHLAAQAGKFRAAAILIRRARDLPNVEDKNLILRIKNRQGNTALHEAVQWGKVDMVCYLLSEDLEPVYWKNAAQKSPLYLAIDISDFAIQEVLFSLSLEPSRIQGLPPIHGAVMRDNYGLVTKILEKNMKLFAMTDSRGGNVFHLAAYKNHPSVFKFLQSETEYLARERDMNGDLPIHIAAKMGYVDLIQKLHSVSHLLNVRGQTLLHVAVKYGRTSTVRYILGHPELGKLINERDHAGNTPLHLGAMYSQPAALIPLVQDKRTDPLLQNHKCLAALDIALDRLRQEIAFRKELAVMVLVSTFGYNTAVSPDLIVHRPECRDEAFSIYQLLPKKLSDGFVKGIVKSNLLVATLVATVTFTAGFAVPGGFNGSDTPSKVDWGMATMLHKRMFQAFAICNTIAMCCSMTAIVCLIIAQQMDAPMAMANYMRSVQLLIIALPAMSVAFLNGVTLTVGKLPWLANTIFYIGLLFILTILVSKLLEIAPVRLFRGHRSYIRLLRYWVALSYIYLWGVETDLLDDSEEYEMWSETSV